MVLIEEALTCHVESAKEHIGFDLSHFVCIGHLDKLQCLFLEVLLILLLYYLRVLLQLLEGELFTNLPLFLVSELGVKLRCFYLVFLHHVSLLLRLGPMVLVYRRCLLNDLVLQRLLQLVELLVQT